MECIFLDLSCYVEHSRESEIAWVVSAFVLLFSLQDERYFKCFSSYFRISVDQGTFYVSFHERIVAVINGLYMFAWYSEKIWCWDPLRALKCRRKLPLWSLTLVHWQMLHAVNVVCSSLVSAILSNFVVPCMWSFCRELQMYASLSSGSQWKDWGWQSLRQSVWNVEIGDNTLLRGRKSNLRQRS